MSKHYLTKELFTQLAPSLFRGVSEWPKEHDWKSCNRGKTRFGGLGAGQNYVHAQEAFASTNPSASANLSSLQQMSHTLREGRKIMPPVSYKEAMDQVRRAISCPEGVYPGAGKTIHPKDE